MARIIEKSLKSIKNIKISGLIETQRDENLKVSLRLLGRAISRMNLEPFKSRHDSQNRAPRNLFSMKRCWTEAAIRGVLWKKVFLKI